MAKWTTQLWRRKTLCIDSMLKYCAANRKRRLSALPNVGSYIYTTLRFPALQEAPCIYDISRLRVKVRCLHYVPPCLTLNNFVVCSQSVFMWIPMMPEHAAVTPLKSTKLYLGAFAKLRKAAISFVMSLRMSVRPSIRIELPSSHLTNFREIWCFSKNYRELPIFIKIWQE
jgi:hypothetical protein